MSTASTRHDVIVAGSGPGGAGVARDLARAGIRVLILERGRDWRGHALYGTYAGAMLYSERRALLFTRERMQIVRPLMVGGATSMFAGCCAPPPDWLHERYGVDVRADAARLHDELGVAPLPAELRGAGSTLIAQAGRSIGMHWEPQDKFMQPSRARSFDCGAHCLLGCRCGAKWNAGQLVDDAVAAGAELRTRARVLRVIVERGAAVGVSGRSSDGPFEARAPIVILAAGGLGSPMLLRTAGIAAGTGIAMDTTTIVYGSGAVQGEVGGGMNGEAGGMSDAVPGMNGEVPGMGGEVPGMGGDPPMTWSSADPELDVLYSTLMDPWLMYPIAMLMKGPAAALTWPRWGRSLGVMIKLRDELSGTIDERGRVSKGLTAADARRLDAAEQTARRILVAAGCRPESLIRSPLRGTHPSATARIGDVVDRELGTSVRGLYVCDASVFPEALGRPTVLTILALARRLARTLTAGHMTHTGTDA